MSDSEELDVIKTEVDLDVKAMYPEFDKKEGSPVYIIQTATGFLVEFDVDEGRAIIPVTAEINENGEVTGITRGLQAWVIRNPKP